MHPASQQLFRTGARQERPILAKPDQLDREPVRPRCRSRCTISVVLPTLARRHDSVAEIGESHRLDRIQQLFEIRSRVRAAVRPCPGREHDDVGRLVVAADMKNAQPVLGAIDAVERHGTRGRSGPATPAPRQPDRDEDAPLPSSR